MKVFQYLTTLDARDLEDLYKDSWTCQAIVRSLPPRAKQYIFKMLMVDTYPLTIAKDWSQHSSNHQHKEALKKLFDLKIILLNRGKQQSEQSIQLNPLFQENIKSALVEFDKVIFSNSSNIKDTNKIPNINDLDNYSKKQWEQVLYFLSDDAAQPSKFISDLLLSSNLTRRDQDGSLSITSDGFKFLLKDVYTQIWTLLIVYLNDLEKKRREGLTQGSRNDLLGFLFRLSFLQLGKGYLVGELTELQKEYLICLKQFGLIYMKSDASLFFYPTRLIISLTTGKTLSLIQTLAVDKINSSSNSANTVASSTIEKKESGYIVLETNYRLYAYTASSLQISLLSLFVKMLYRLPNLAVGIITRESIRTALIHGITADQIIDFIRHNAHPNAVNNGQPIPDVVAEQILLWEQERNRITYTKSVLYNSFPTTDCYHATLKFAKEQDYYIWSNDQLKTLVVNENGNDPIRNFIKKNFA
ncbi:hypothetical protein DICPUDRAFT_31198 [Dictyostelium purpureum]|uniref:General transcription factor IIH subunit 4 n=1 Tax=Dictyostelium purpureum TaxID=5786 RepID=F0ZGU8_DICPU|nr:uncharacterized protein DICPUDRAFT_31198 [Dictyostelium purpureum]EGC36839.1 hypothetical protein DICPUDRAFT_31198 [Dictyostelium purpureum]|eukprot:XP_003286637.1 hypothetical protein DICPUDRAFT_31198 [Dictyostelium purpureum]